MTAKAVTSGNITVSILTAYAKGKIKRRGYDIIAAIFHTQFLFLYSYRLSDNVFRGPTKESKTMTQIFYCRECGEMIESQNEKDYCSNYCRLKHITARKKAVSFFKDVEI